MFEIVYAAEVPLAIYRDDACQLDDLLQPGFDLSLLGIGRAVVDVDTGQVKVPPGSGWGSVGLQGHYDKKKREKEEKKVGSIIVLFSENI